MIGLSLLFAIAFIFLSTAQNVCMLFIGRILCGMASGTITIAAPTYISEVASPNIRGMLGSCFQVIIYARVIHKPRGHFIT